MFHLIHATHGWRVLGVLNIYEWNEYFRCSIVVVARRHRQTGNRCSEILSHNSKRPKRLGFDVDGRTLICIRR